MQADVLIRQSSNEGLWWIDVQTPAGDVLYSSQDDAYPALEATDRGKKLAEEWHARGFAVDVVFDGNVI